MRNGFADSVEVNGTSQASSEQPQRALAGPGIGGSTCETHSTSDPPPGIPDRAGASGRITPRQNFRALNLLAVTAQRSPNTGFDFAVGRACAALMRTSALTWERELPARILLRSAQASGNVGKDHRAPDAIRARRTTNFASMCSIRVLACSSRKVGTSDPSAFDVFR